MTDNNNILFNLDTLSLQLDNVFHAEASEANLDDAAEKLNDMFNAAGSAKKFYRVPEEEIRILPPEYALPTIGMTDITPLKRQERPSSNTGPDLSL